MGVVVGAVVGEGEEEEEEEVVVVVVVQVWEMWQVVGQFWVVAAVALRVKFGALGLAAPPLPLEEVGEVGEVLRQRFSEPSEPEFRDPEILLPLLSSESYFLM